MIASQTEISCESVLRQNREPNRTIDIPTWDVFCSAPADGVRPAMAGDSCVEDRLTPRGDPMIACHSENAARNGRRFPRGGSTNSAWTPDDCFASQIAFRVEDRLTPRESPMIALLSVIACHIDAAWRID